jgi:hypothetical protein
MLMLRFTRLIEVIPSQPRWGSTAPTGDWQCLPRDCALGTCGCARSNWPVGQPAYSRHSPFSREGVGSLSTSWRYTINKVVPDPPFYPTKDRAAFNRARLWRATGKPRAGEDPGSVAFAGNCQDYGGSLYRVPEAHKSCGVNARRASRTALDWLASGQTSKH